MVAKEVSPDQLLNELVGIMKKEGMVSPPQWASFVKTGAHAQRPPDDPDWWYMRSASVLRQVYMRGPIGVGKLRRWYGGRKNRGAKPERHYPAGGKIIRSCLQQLEVAGLLEKAGTGRKLTAKGQSLIDKTSAKLKPRIDKSLKAKPKKAPAKKKAASKKEVKPKTEAKPKAEAKPKEAKPKTEAVPKEEKPKAEKPKEPKPKKETTAKPKPEEPTPVPEPKGDAE